MIKKYYSRQLDNEKNTQINFSRFTKIIKNDKKILIYLSICLGLLLILPFLFIKKNKTRQSQVINSPLVFNRQLVGPYAYTGEVAGVMTTSFTTNKDVGIVEVKRDNSKLQFDIPISNSTVNGTNGSFFNPTDISFVSEDKVTAIKYNLIPDGLKEEIILNKIPQENMIPIKLKIENLKLKLTSDGTPVFFDNSGKYQFNFERPFVKDGAGNISYGVNFIFPNSQQNKFKTQVGSVTRQTLLTADLETKDTTNIVVQIDSNWLHDKKRVLPITIDPTVIHNTSSVFATGSFNRTNDAGGSITAPATDVNTVGVWHFDESTNSTCSPSGKDACDSSGNNLDGTSIGSTIVTGKTSLARSFNGSSNYITVNDNPALDFTGDFTISGWIYRISAAGTLISKTSTPGTSGYALLYGAQGEVYCRTDNGSTNVDSITAWGAIPISVWTHVAAVKTGASCRIYINGVDQTISDPSHGINAVNSTALAIGARADHTTEFTNGYIDEVKISNVARSASYILQESQAVPSISAGYHELPADQYTMGLWHLDEGGGSNINDSSGYNNTGKATGTTVISGLLNKARSFNGTSDFIEIGAGGGSSLDIDSNPVTLEAWVNTNAINATNVQRIVNRGQTGTTGYGMYIDTAGKAHLGGDGGSNFAGNTTLVPGVWYHIAGIINGAESKIYVNGSLDGMGTINVVASTLPLQIGADWSGGTSSNYDSFFNGKIDEVRVSNIARTAAEIAADASLSPSGVYTSPLVDLGYNVTSWSNLIWTNAGANTGNGETVSNSTGLVAQWNFNSVSGTAVTNDAGSCGASCNGTLSGFFPSTSGQDVTPRSGWTANNKRWGGGALMMDASILFEYALISGTPSLSNINVNLSIETWIKTNSNVSRQEIMDHFTTDPPSAGWGIVMQSGKISCWVGDSGGGFVTSNRSVNDDAWHYIACTLNGNTVSIYIDGVLDISATRSPSLNSAVGMVIGNASGNAHPFDGIIDTSRVYSRALTPSEIVSNYNAGSLTFQTRVGASTDPNDGTWQAWSPTSNETQIDSMDTSYQYNTTDSGLVSYWPMDEISGTTVGDVVGTNSGTATGAIVSDGKFGKARGFSAVTDMVDTGTATALDNVAAYSVCAWVKPNSYGVGNPRIYFKGVGTGTTNYDSLFLDNTTLVGAPRMYAGYSTQNVDSTATGSNFVVPLGRWSFICGTWNGGTAASSIKLYLNGTESPTYGNPIAGTGSRSNVGHLIIGNRVAQDRNFDGVIDEVRVYNNVLSAATIQQYFREGSTNGDFMRPMSDTTTKLEGTASEKIRAGKIPIDSHTAALWHFEETNGSGSYIADSSVNAVNATPFGTTVDNGIFGKARTFSTNNDRIITGSTSILNTDTHTIEFWIRFNGNPTTSFTQILAYRPAGTDRSPGIWNNPNNNCIHWRYDPGNTGGASCGGPAGENTYFNTNQWYHVAGVKSGSVFRFYVNGNLAETSVVAATKTAGNAPVEFGETSFSPANMTLDEVRISNIARTDDEIADDYRNGRDNYLNKTYSSIDLSGKTSLPFYIAADRPGSYLSAIIGNNPYVNYQPDINTVGLWHLDENTGLINGENPYNKSSLLGWWHLNEASGNAGDSSGNAFTLTNTSTTYSAGKFNNAGVFNGAASEGCSDVACGTTAKLDLGTSDFTISAWIKTTSAGTPQEIVRKGNGGATYYLLRLDSGKVTASYRDSLPATVGTTGSTTINDGNWHHVAGVFSRATGVSIYVDGVLDGSVTGTATASIDNAEYFCIGSSSAAGSCTTEFFNGSIDEVRVYTRALSATEINADANGPVLLKDSSGYGNNGYPAGGGTNIQGKIGLAKSFNGTSDYINTKTSSIFQMSSNITTEAWIKTTTTPASNTVIVRKDMASGTRYLYGLIMDTAGKVNAQYYNGTSFLVPSANAVTDNNWHYAVATINNGNILSLYLDGVLQGSTTITGIQGSPNGELDIGAAPPNTPAFLRTGFFTGSIDEVRVSNIMRSATDIRQAYEVGLRTHQVTIDFGATIDNINTITNSGDTSFIIDATQKGLFKKGSNLYTGDKVIVRENYNGTEYIAQGTVNSIGVDTGAVTVAAWDGGSTFPPSGFDLRADVFKWQREYWNIKNSTTQPNLDVNAITLLTLSLTDGNEGRTIWLDDLKNATDYLNIPAGSTITSPTGFRYIQYRTIFDSFDPAVSASLNSVTVSDVLQAPPGAPSLDLPANSATNQSPTLLLKTTATDPNGDYIRYKIQVCTNSGMTQGCQTFDQTSSQIGWSGQNAQAGTAYNSGTQGVFTVPYLALSPLTSYYWQTYAIDPAGSNTWSSTQVSPFIFTTAHLPNMPVLNSPANNANNIGILAQLKTTATDSSNDYLRYKIFMCTDLAMTLGCQTFDETISQAGWSGQNAQAGTAYSSGSLATYTIQTPLSLNTTYYWRSYAIDPGGTNSWSLTQSPPNVFYTTGFTAPTSPTALLTNNLSNPSNVSLASAFFFSAIHNDITNISANYYQIQVSNQADFGGTILWDSGQTIMAVTANGTRSPNITYTGATLTPNGQTFYWRIRFWDTSSSGNPGAWSLPGFFGVVNIASPASCLLVKNNSNTQMIINWSTRATASNNYLEKNTDSGGFTAYQTLSGATNTYTDSSVSSGHTYQYRVRSLSGVDYSDWCMTATLSLAVGNLRFNGIK